MREKRAMILTLFWAVLFFSSGSVQAEAESMPGCLELLQDRCQVCHYLTRVCQEVGEKSKRRWAATLKRMVKRRGATLSAQEHDFLLNCLVTPAPAIKEECGK